MKRSRFTEEQIIGVLGEQEAGMQVAELCRKHGISQPKFYLFTSLRQARAVLASWRPRSDWLLVSCGPGL